MVNDCRRGAALALLILPALLAPVLPAQTPSDSADFKLAADLYGRGLHWEAEAAFRRVTEAWPAFGQAWFGLAMCHYETRRLEAALPLFERAECCPDPEAQAFTNHAVTLELLSRVDEARRLLDRAVKLDPKHANGWLNLGKIAARCGETRVAREHLARCLELEPRNVAALLQMAHLEFRAGRLDAARARVKRVLALDAGHVGATYLAARIARRAGDTAAARRLLARWRVLHDAAEKRRRVAARVGGLMPLAFAELRAGRISAAVEYLAEVLAVDPSNPHAHSVLEQIAASSKDAALRERIGGLLSPPSRPSGDR